MKVECKPREDGKVDISVACKCGKPVVKSTKTGMWCEDECGKKEADAKFELGINTIREFFPECFK